MRFFDDRACQVNVEINYDESMILAFLREVSAAQFGDVSETKPLALSPIGALANTSFQYRAMVHPSRAGGGLSKTTQFMPWSNWARAPAPALARRSRSPATDGTFRVKVTGLRPTLVVAGDGRGVVGYAGARLLADLAKATGPDRGFDQALPVTRPAPGFSGVPT